MGVLSLRCFVASQPTSSQVRATPIANSGPVSPYYLRIRVRWLAMLGVPRAGDRHRVRHGHSNHVIECHLPWPGTDCSDECRDDPTNRSAFHTAQFPSPTPRRGCEDVGAALPEPQCATPSWTALVRGAGPAPVALLPTPDYRAAPRQQHSHRRLPLHLRRCHRPHRSLGRPQLPQAHPRPGWSGAHSRTAAPARCQ